MRSYRKPLVYFRFIDDVWGLWTHGRDAFLDFHTKGNQFNPMIKLELRYSTLYIIARVSGHRDVTTEAEVYTQTSTQRRPTIYICVSLNNSFP